MRSDTTPCSGSASSDTTGARRATARSTRPSPLKSRAAIARGSNSTVIGGTRGTNAPLPSLIRTLTESSVLLVTARSMKRSLFRRPESIALGPFPTSTVDVTVNWPEPLLVRIETVPAPPAPAFVTARSTESSPSRRAAAIALGLLPTGTWSIISKPSQLPSLSVPLFSRMKTMSVSTATARSGKVSPLKSSDAVALGRASGRLRGSAKSMTSSMPTIRATDPAPPGLPVDGYSTSINLISGRPVLKATSKGPPNRPVDWMTVRGDPPAGGSKPLMKSRNSPPFRETSPWKLSWSRWSPGANPPRSKTTPPADSGNSAGPIWVKGMAIVNVPIAFSEVVSPGDRSPRLRNSSVPESTPAPLIRAPEMLNKPGPVNARFPLKLESARWSVSRVRL